MAMFIPDKNIKSNISYGQAINQVVKEYVFPELKKRNLKDYVAAGIEIFTDNKTKIYFDNEVQLTLEFKKTKFKPGCEGKQINVNLHDIKDIKWNDKTLNKNSVKILIVHFNKDWWIWSTDFKQRKDLEEKFKVTRSFTVRGSGYLPSNYHKKEKEDFFKGWHSALERELPLMWRRNIAVSQRYKGVMVYDGNYFDLFFHAQDLYVLGYYYPSIIICRSAAEQALVSILIKTGKAFDIYKINRGKKKLKSIEQLVETCRSHSLFGKKYPINKTSAKKLNEISKIASNLVHPKHELDALDVYKDNALKCMDNLQYVIKNHLNFIKDTGTVSGYKISGSVKRLQ